MSARSYRSGHSSHHGSSHSSHSGWGHHTGSSGFGLFRGFFGRSHYRTHSHTTYRTDARTEPPAEGDFGEEEEQPDYTWLCCAIPAGVTGAAWLVAVVRRLTSPSRRAIS